MQNCQARRLVEDGAPVDGAPSSQFLTNLVPTLVLDTQQHGDRCGGSSSQISRPQPKQGVPTCAQGLRAPLAPRIALEVAAL